MRFQKMFQAGLATLIMAGSMMLVTPSAFAASCGDVIMTDTTLTADIVNCGVDALTVGSDGVTIDLNGHTIDGTLTPGMVAIRIDGFEKVVVTGGELTQFEAGVSVSNGGSVDISFVDAHDNALAGVLVDQASASILGSQLDDNFFVGLWATDQSKVSVSKSSIQDNTDYGLLFDATTHFAMSSNTVADNGHHGVLAIDAKGSLDGDELTGNARSGLAVVGASGEVTAVGIRSHMNWESGVEVSNATVGIEDSELHSNPDYGASVGPAGSLKIAGSVLGNNGTGALLYGGQLTIDSSTIRGNGTGVEITSGDALLLANRVSASTLDGVKLSGGTTSLGDNDSSWNGGCGYSIGGAAVAINLGGNTGFGNGGGFVC